MKKYLAEFLGTFMLVFLGTSAVVIAKGDVLTIALAFGMAITMSAYSFGAVSGGHFNPAVTTGMIIDHRIDWKNGLYYIVSQILGAIVASLLVRVYVSAMGFSTKALGQTDFTISAGTAFLVETVATFLFVLIILLVTSKTFGNPNFAGLIIGIALTFLIVATIKLTGASLNPARSIGPALFAQGTSLTHLWLYILAPEIGGVLAAFVSRFFTTED